MISTNKDTITPYFFAPAAEPLHDVISPWQRDFQLTIGKNNARYFDEKGWLYFTKEVFDLYYPSYGDTYPTYSGASLKKLDRLLTKDLSAQ